MRYPLGATVRLYVTFTDADNAVADPTTVTVKVQNPALEEATYTDAVKDSTGKYHRDVVATAAGRWFWRWIAAGTLSAVDEGDFYVENVKAGPALVQGEGTGVSAQFWLTPFDLGVSL